MVPPAPLASGTSTRSSQIGGRSAWAAQVLSRELFWGAMATADAGRGPGGGRPARPDGADRRAGAGGGGCPDETTCALGRAPKID